MTWALFHASGVHATFAGALLGLVVPARELAGRFEHRWRPWSTGLTVPIFALFSAGVAFGGLTGLLEAIGTAVALGVAAGLVVGTTLGVLGATFLPTRLPGARLDPSMRWTDVAALAPLTGVGFTVTLLVGELAGNAADDDAKVGVLCGSLVAAVLGGVLLYLRAGNHRTRKAARIVTGTDHRAATPSDGSPLRTKMHRPHRRRYLPSAEDRIRTAVTGMLVEVFDVLTRQ